jgi:BirA family biotin operon repressor/biotin-[acetyl-CoA-carboxylase] ligase
MRDPALPLGDPALPLGDPAIPLGSPRLHLRRTDSTNERARALAAAGAPHGTLVTAAEQTAGRGRQGRRWSAPAGSALLMSLLLREPPALLPLIGAVAVCEAVGEEVRIKWPNDIVLARGESFAKLAGILIEGRPQEGWAVLGVGVNVAVRIEELPPELRATGASLGLARAAIEPLLARLLRALERRLSEPPTTVLDAWRAYDGLHGREISWAAGRGRAAGIDNDGRLIVALSDGGHITLDAGEVHLAVVG